jgi:hypothetical protein
MGASRGARGRGQGGTAAGEGEPPGAVRGWLKGATGGGTRARPRGRRGTRRREGAGRDRGRAREGARPGTARRGAARGGVGAPGAWAGRPRGDEEGEGEGKRERERGVHLGDPNSSDHRLQDLGHHRKRERSGREVAAQEKSNEIKRPGEGGTRMGRARALGARGPRPGQAGPGRAGLGWAAPRVKTPWHAQPQIGKSIHETETETKLSNARD